MSIRITANWLAQSAELQKWMEAKVARLEALDKRPLTPQERVLREEYLEAEEDLTWEWLSETSRTRLDQPFDPSKD
jgi:hypothetical protein